MNENTHNESIDETEDPGDSRLTELVAYLDGELAELDSDRLEQELVSDAPLRSYAESLDRTWRLLDSLGETTASGEFTQKTLASLEALPLDADGQFSRQPLRMTRLVSAVPWLKIGLWCLVGFAGGSAGLLLSRSANPQRTESEDTKILRQLDLLQDYQKIRPVPDVEFLKNVAATTESETESKGTVP